MAKSKLMKAKSLVAEALNIPENSLSGASNLDNTDQWDSLGHMRIIMAMESTIGRNHTGTEIMDITSCKDIAAILN